MTKLVRSLILALGFSSFSHAAMPVQIPINSLIDGTKNSTEQKKKKTKGKKIKAKVGMCISGIASWYGKPHHGRKTASGEVFNMYKMTAAHRTLPLGTMVKVTNTDNGKSVIVKINDRGPFIKNRVLDLSYEAAKKLNMVNSGHIKVLVQII
jgi:rare lipoprotein A